MKKKNSFGKSIKTILTNHREYRVYSDHFVIVQDDCRCGGDVSIEYIYLGEKTGVLVIGKPEELKELIAVASVFLDAIDSQSSGDAI